MYILLNVVTYLVLVYTRMFLQQKLFKCYERMTSSRIFLKRFCKISVRSRVSTYGLNEFIYIFFNIREVLYKHIIYILDYSCLHIGAVVQCDDAQSSLCHVFRKYVLPSAFYSVVTYLQYASATRVSKQPSGVALTLL